MEKSEKVVEKRIRTVSDLSISGRKVYLHLSCRKFRKQDGSKFWEVFSFVRPNSRMTQRYEQYLFKLCKGADIHYVAKQEDLQDDSVGQVFHLYAKKN